MIEFAEIAVTAVCAFVVIRHVASRIRSQRKPTIAEQQRHRRYVTTERVKREQYFGEWWSTR